MRLAPGFLATVLVLAGCQPQERASEPVFSPTVTVLTGYRFHNWEYGHTLFALGLDGPVCLTDTRTGRRLSEVDETRFTELHGHLSARGSYGGMARCAYAFEVTEVVQDREPTQSDRELLGDLFKVVSEPAPGATPGARYEMLRDR